MVFVETENFLPGKNDNQKQKRELLFSLKADWIDPISLSLDNYRASFKEFEIVNPAAYETIVPLTIEDMIFINRPRSDPLFKERSICPDIKTLKLCDNKLRFARFLIANGFEGTVPKLKHQKRLPFILKPKIGEWGENIEIIDSPEQFEKFREKIESPHYYCQQLIAGHTEFTTHFIFDRELLFYRTFKFEYDEALFVKGQSLRPKSITPLQNDSYRDLFTDILRALNFRGIGCFNFKIVDGIPKIFELNPRFGASMTHVLDEAMKAYSFAVARKNKSRPIL